MDIEKILLLFDFSRRITFCFMQNTQNTQKPTGRKACWHKAPTISYNSADHACQLSFNHDFPRHAIHFHEIQALR